MFRHTQELQYSVKPDRPDALFAAKLQDLVGGQFGEMTVMMQYLWQGWNCRIPRGRAARTGHETTQLSRRGMANSGGCRNDGWFGVKQ